jgi:hypothetical protein
VAVDRTNDGLVGVQGTRAKVPVDDAQSRSSLETSVTQGCRRD